MSTPNKTKVSLFLDPEVARTLAVLAAQAGMDRSTLVTYWVTHQRTTRETTTS